MTRTGRPAGPRLFEVVRVVDLEPIVLEAGCGASFEFRIEIRRELGRRRFRSTVYRRDSFRLTPASPAGPEAGGDQPLFVPDPCCEPVEARSSAAVLRRAVAGIAAAFGLGAPGRGKRPAPRA